MSEAYKVTYEVGDLVQIMAKVVKYGTSRGYVTGVFADYISVNIDKDTLMFRYDEIYKV